MWHRLARLSYTEPRIDISALFSLGLLQLVSRDTYALLFLGRQLYTADWHQSEFALGKMPPSQKAAAKKPRMTLAQVSAYDDILTDALVDHVSGL